MLHTSSPFRVIHQRFIACCYRRGCPAVALQPLHSEFCSTAAGFASVFGFGRTSESPGSFSYSSPCCSAPGS
jgi:hypothetical protein